MSSSPVRESWMLSACCMLQCSCKSDLVDDHCVYCCYGNAQEREGVDMLAGRRVFETELDKKFGKDVGRSPGGAEGRCGSARCAQATTPNARNHSWQSSTKLLSFYSHGTSQRITIDQRYVKLAECPQAAEGSTHAQHDTAVLATMRPKTPMAARNGAEGHSLR